LVSLLCFIASLASSRLFTPLRGLGSVGGFYRDLCGIFGLHDVYVSLNIFY